MGQFHFPNISKSKKKKGRTTETIGEHLNQAIISTAVHHHWEHIKPERQKISKDPDRAQSLWQPKVHSAKGDSSL